MTTNPNLKMDYIEFTTRKIRDSKAFFKQAFGWSYVEYGPDYAEIREAGVVGGFAQADAAGPPLIVLKADDLEAAEKAVLYAGGFITKAIFDFPGGRRFHFREPGGNELAVWSEK